VLGEVTVTGDDGTVTKIAAPKPRALLALLILNANRAVNTQVLVDSLWGEALPEVPFAALQVVVSRLRSGLGPCGERVVGVPGGYRLDAGPDETDVGFAEALLRDGRAALGRGDAAGATAAFARALSLWTGDPLEGLTHARFAVEARRRLEELRLSVVEARNDALLLEGRHLEVLADIEHFVDVAPLREHLRAQHVAALYRAGRQAEALRVCDALRHALRDLGLDPSPAMQDLERRVLDQDPRLLTRAGFITPLPASTAESLPFVGRDDEYEQVLSWFAEAVRGGVRVAVVEGDAGIGKSRFLLEIARNLARDAIVLPVHVHDVFRPALHEFARVLAEANLRLSDSELQQMTDDVPDLTGETARVRQVASAFIAGRAPNQVFPDERFLRHVAPWIAALSAKAPVVIVVDDLPTVGSSFLRVVWELTMLSTPKRVLIIGSTRTPVEHTLAPGLVRTLHALDRRGLLRRITLHPLAADDVDDLLARMYVAPRSELVGPLYALTAGNPFMLAETLSLGTPEQVVGQWSSPPRVRDVARQRTAELGRATAELLALACLFETDFTLDTIAHATGTSTATAATLVDRAVTARVLQPSTLSSYCFAHQLFRHALVGDLSPAERQAGHRAIAGALEETGASPAQLALHWSGSAGPDVPAKVARYARAAGRDALRLFEPNTAAEWFALALEYLPDDAERGGLLVELADARQLAGDPRSHATLQEAVELALATNDDALTLAIVRASSSGWVHLLISGAADLLDRALEVVNDDATRARILARQAVDVSVTDPPAAERIADEAVVVARRSGDTSALAEALLRRMSVSLAPHSLAARQRALPELLDASAQSTDIPTRYFALSTAVLTAIQTGDLTQVDQYGAQADTLSLSYAIAPMQWSTMVRRAWRTGLAGRLEDVERLIEDAHTYGTDAAIAGAAETALMQRGLLRWQQDQMVHALPAARTAFDNFNTTMPGIALVLARALAAHETSHDDARTVFSEFAADRFAQLRRGTFWSSLLVISAETAYLLDLSDMCTTIRDLLLPFADQVAFTGSWVTAPIAYGIGIAMRGCDDRRARELLDRAADIAERLKAPVLVARARDPFLHNA